MATTEIQHITDPDGTSHALADLVARSRLDNLPTTADLFDYFDTKYGSRTDGSNYGLKNSLYRGKNLGTPTDAQYAAIKNKSCKGLWLGDYYTIDGVKYVFAGFGMGDHVGDNTDPNGTALLITEKNMLNGDGKTTKYMMDTNTIPETGYIGTKMWTDTLPNSVLPKVQKAFSTHLLTHREMLCNGAKDGVPTSFAWTDVQVNIPNQVMVYGTQAWRQGVYGDGYNVGSSHQILPLFVARPDLVNNRTDYWLRDFTSSTRFAHVNRRGYANADGAWGSWYGVRPYVIID